MTYHDIKAAVLPILRRQGVVKAALFGSFAREDAGPASDVDLLVRLAPGKSLLDLVSLRLELAARLRRKVDVLTYDSLNPMLKARILKEQRLIYEKRA